MGHSSLHVFIENDAMPEGQYMKPHSSSKLPQQRRQPALNASSNSRKDAGRQGSSCDVPRRQHSKGPLSSGSSGSCSSSPDGVLPSRVRQPSPRERASLQMQRPENVLVKALMVSADLSDDDAPNLDNEVEIILGERDYSDNEGEGSDEDAVEAETLPAHYSRSMARQQGPPHATVGTSKSNSGSRGSSGGGGGMAYREPQEGSAPPGRGMDVSHWRASQAMAERAMTRSCSMPSSVLENTPGFYNSPPNKDGRAHPSALGKGGAYLGGSGAGAGPGQGQFHGMGVTRGMPLQQQKQQRQGGMRGGHGGDDRGGQNGGYLAGPAATCSPDRYHQQQQQQQPNWQQQQQQQQQHGREGRRPAGNRAFLRTYSQGMVERHGEQSGEWDDLHHGQVAERWQHGHGGRDEGGCVRESREPSRGNGEAQARNGPSGRWAIETSMEDAGKDLYPLQALPPPALELGRAHSLPENNLLAGLPALEIPHKSSDTPRDSLPLPLSKAVHKNLAALKHAGRTPGAAGGLPRSRSSGARLTPPHPAPAVPRPSGLSLMKDLRVIVPGAEDDHSDDNAAVRAQRVARAAAARKAVKSAARGNAGVGLNAAVHGASHRH